VENTFEVLKGLKGDRTFEMLITRVLSAYKLYNDA
jgi:hypothetical protein